MLRFTPTVDRLRAFPEEPDGLRRPHDVEERREPLAPDPHRFGAGLDGEVGATNASDQLTQGIFTLDLECIVTG